MSDIFISYSRKDIEQAKMLAERLRASGASVWIDTAALGAAEIWSGEIVTAIEGCKMFFVLLSEHSVASVNVNKEVSLASESKKIIVPVVIQKCPLSPSMKYALAGLQKVYLHDEDALVRSLGKLGLGGTEFSGTDSESVRGASPDGLRVRPTDIESELLRIAVLPFEDQSPAHDNEWFSDGLTDELISTLGKLEKLFVVDSQSSRIYKNAKLSAKEIASQLDVRYIVRGSVRKAAEKIRVQATLIDTSDGATLYDEKFSGIMNDIFEIQEKTAVDITQGLKLKLTKDEVAEIEDRGTDNPEAYELYLRAIAHIGEAQEEMLQNLDWLKEAVTLDPNFAKAYAVMAVRYANYFRSHGRKSETLRLQREATEKAVALAPRDIHTFNALANLYANTGEKEKAIETAKNMVRVAPKYAGSYGVTAFMYVEAGKLFEAAQWFEKALAINPGSLRDHHNITAVYSFSGDKGQMKKSAIRSIPYYEQYLALHPDDQSLRAQLMLVFELIDKQDSANREADRLLAMPNLFGHTYYQISSFYGKQGMTEKAVELLYKAAGKGYINFEELRNDKDWFGCVQALPDFEKLVGELEDTVKKSNV